MLSLSRHEKNKWIDPPSQANSYHTSVLRQDLYKKKVSLLTNKLVLSQVLDYTVIIPVRFFHTSFITAPTLSCPHKCTEMVGITCLSMHAQRVKMLIEKVKIMSDGDSFN